MSRILAVSFGVGITLALSGCGGNACVGLVKGLDAAACVKKATVTPETYTCLDEKFCDKCKKDRSSDNQIQDQADLMKDGTAAEGVALDQCYLAQTDACKCTAMLSSLALPADAHTNTTFSTV